METMTILLELEWAQHPTAKCVGQHVIPASNFESLSESIAANEESKMTAEEVLSLLQEQSKRFSACGGNNSDSERFAVVRKNPKNGWKYLVDMIKKEP